MGEYGSGRFCCSKCARSYSTKENRIEINKKVSLKLKGRHVGGGLGFRKGFDPNRRKFDDNDRIKAKIEARKVLNERIENTPFEKLGKTLRKRILIKERGYQCECCKLIEWLGHKIPLHEDHIDGNHFNHCKNNLRLLCPNCHALTPTWKGRNINNKNEISDEDLLKNIKSSKNIRQALIKSNLTPKAGNYSRAYNLSVKNDLTFS